MSLHAELQEEIQVHRDEVAAAAARRAREVTEALPPYWRVSELALQFPSLHGYDNLAGLYPFDADRFHSATRAMSHGQRASADFVLSVFNVEWPFDLHDAMGVWDRRHRAVFAQWVANPWWA